MNTYRFLVVVEDAGNTFLRTHPTAWLRRDWRYAGRNGKEMYEAIQLHIEGCGRTAFRSPSHPRSPNTFSSVRSGWSLLLNTNPTFAPFVATPSWIA